MTYTWKLLPEAEPDLWRLPSHEQEAVVKALDNLAEAPTKLSRPGRPPRDWSEGQVFEFQYGPIGFKIQFFYRDEVYLDIAKIGRIPYAIK